MAKITASDLMQQVSQALNATTPSSEEKVALKEAKLALFSHEDDTRVASQLKMKLSLLAVQQRLSSEGVELLSWLVKTYPGRSAQIGLGLTHL
ncbi:hypothetical protein [Lacticaseibacillus jixiensis]|uniref:hypothetical protein n=1 Tax=Lacticaseibacillus jixiensis TaxID=3231926 RepID=UPI0036F382E9